MGKINDITGKKFNMLTALEPIRVEPKIGAIWKFKCECGNIVELPASKVTNKERYKILRMFEQEKYSEDRFDWKEVWQTYRIEMRWNRR